VGVKKRTVGGLSRKRGLRGFAVERREFFKKVGRTGRAKK